jgi:hypothetical protein
MDLELRLRDALVLEDTSDDFIARVMARVDNPQVIDIRSRRRSRFIVIGTLAVVGIAAAMCVWWLPRPESGLVSALLSPAQVAPPALKPVASGPVPEITLPPAEPEAVVVTPAWGDLPLVPVPARRQPGLAKSLLVLQKAVERHPDLVQGPELEDSSASFLVSMTMRRDGGVINSAAELASPATSFDIDMRLSQNLPAAAVERFDTGFGKGYPLPDGNTLRARVSLSAVFIPDSFDIARSDVRVREILGQKYDHLMTPSSGDELNVLTVFLSDEGRILREKVERVTMQNADAVMGLVTGARREEAIAAHLGIAVEQIGLIGVASLGQGTDRMLAVRYAWARRMDEPASVHTPRRADEPVTDFDLAAARVVVEHLLPDAFSHAAPSFSDFYSMPTVVFTGKGEVMRAGRVQMRMGVNVDSLLQEHLVPGVVTHSHRTVRLTNEAGATGMVQFAWEK